MIDIDSSWFSIEIKPQPVVHFKRKYIRRGTDLKYQVINAGTVYGSTGHQQQIVFGSSVRLHKFIDGYYLFIGFAVFQSLPESSRLNTFLEAQEYLCIFFTIENIIGFVLGDGFAKIITDIL